MLLDVPGILRSIVEASWQPSKDKMEGVKPSPRESGLLLGHHRATAAGSFLKGTCEPSCMKEAYEAWKDHARNAGEAWRLPSLLTKCLDNLACLGFFCRVVVLVRRRDLLSALLRSASGKVNLEYQSSHLRQVHTVSKTMSLQANLGLELERICNIDGEAPKLRCLDLRHLPRRDKGNGRRG